MMRILLFYLFLIPVYSSFAQTLQFEFYRNEDINHPFPVIQSPSAGDTDTKGRKWSSGMSAEQFVFYNSKDTTRYYVNRSAREKAGYNYSKSGWTIVDEDNNIMEKVSGTKSNAGPNFFDDYIPRVDSLGRPSVLHLYDIGADSTQSIINYRSVGGKIVAVSYTGKYFWEGAPQSAFSGPLFPDFHNDRKGTVFTVAKNAAGVLSFHSDGTFRKILQDTVIVNTHYNPANGTLTVLTKTGTYELSGKTKKRIDIPRSAALLNSAQILAEVPEWRTHKKELIRTAKGFSVKEGNSYNTILLTDIAGVDRDSLIADQPVVLQDDSTLLLPYTNDPNRNGTIYLFRYKNGQAALHRKYDLNKLKLTDELRKTFYAGEAGTIFYFHSKSTGLMMVTHDSVVTRVSTSGNCNIDPFVSLKADKDFLWISNISSNPDCAIARAGHPADVITGLKDENANAVMARNLTEAEEITLFDMFGRQVAYGKQPGFNYKDLPEGVYIARAKFNSNQVVSFKIYIGK